MKLLTFALAAVAAAISLPEPAHAISGGAIIVRIPDGAKPRCVNPKQDRIWLTLRRVIVDKSKGWIAKDKSVAIILNAGVKTQPKPISFPLAMEATLEGFSTGQVSVPVEYTLVDGLALSQDKKLLTGVNVEMTMLNMREAGSLGVALQVLLDTTKKLPIPANPATEAASYLLEYANTAVTKGIEAHNENDKLKSATMALNFSPDGKCEGSGYTTFETTGTKIVLQETGVKGPGYVPVDAVGDFCWTADIQPAFVVKAARKQANVSCTDGAFKNQYKPVTNNYVGFFLNAVGSTGVLGASPDADREESLRRCRQHGIEPKDCLG